jgi:hypothetical protein
LEDGAAFFENTQLPDSSAYGASQMRIAFSRQVLFQIIPIP